MTPPTNSTWLKLFGKERVISLRLIASLAVAGLVAGTMLTIARVNEHYTQQALRGAAESQLLLEASNLSLLSQDAMLTEFPELVLVPLITELQENHPEIAYVTIVDHRGTIRGSAEARSVGQPYEPLPGLTATKRASRDESRGQLMESTDLRLAETEIQGGGGEPLGRVIVGIEKRVLADQIVAVRKDLGTYAAILLPVAMVLAAVLMTLLLRPVPALRAGLERIGRGELETPMRIQDPTELGILARSINQMAAQLKTSRDEIRAREAEIVATQKEIVHTLGDVVESRSSETAHHTMRVAAMCHKLALLAGMSEKEADILRMASPMHDVGKIGIPDSILNKPGKLTPDEYEIMKTHAEIGYRILAKSERVILQAAATIAHEHHERWDGHGYPRGLIGEEIHAYGRITSLIDVFDAIYSDRVYRPAMSLEKTLSIIREGRGKHFQPELVDLFLENLDTFLAIHGQFAEMDHCLETLTPVQPESATVEAALVESIPTPAGSVRETVQV